jgi:nitrous oxidase accessory protein NosD
LVAVAVASAAACATGNQLGDTGGATGSGGSKPDAGGTGGTGGDAGTGGAGGEDGGTGDGSTTDACALPAVTITPTPVACGATTTQATLNFSEAVTGVAAGDTVTLTGGGQITGISGGPAVYTVSMSGLAAPGPDSLHVLPQGTSGHIAAACGPWLAAPVVQSVLFDKGAAPGVSVTVANPVSCGTTSTPLTVTFTEPVTGVVAGDTVTVSGSASIAPFQGGPAVYTSTISGLVPGGTYGVNVYPVGTTNKIESADCMIPLSSSSNTVFSEGATTVPLTVAPGPTYGFGAVPVGSSGEQTFTVTPTGGAVSGVTPAVAAPFSFKGGVYPGTGGTCGTSISAACTIVVDYTPTGTCSDFGALQLAYPGCNGTTTVSTNLAGYGSGTGEPTTCASTNTLYVATNGNDSFSGTTPATAKKTIGAALAAAGSGTEIHVALGTYAETLAPSGCVKLFGGYDATFTVRNPTVNVTSVVASVPNGAVITFPGAALHLDGFTVTNTATTGEALSYSGGSSVISNNVLTGAQYGMYFFAHDCGAIHGNVVTGATAGLYFWQSRVPVYDNVAIGTTAGVTTWQNEGILFSGNDVRGGTYGLQTFQNQGAVFDGNRFTGTSEGVYGYQSTGVVYRNNYVYGGTVALSESSSAVVVASNDIVGPATGLSVGATDYVVVDNIFLGTGPASVGINGTLPSSIENNLFFGLVTFASVGGAPATTAAAVNALDGNTLVGLPSGCSGPTCWTARADGNVTTTLLPSAVFVNLAGPDASVATLSDDDWHLLTNDATITQGGKDASGVTCGSHQTPRSCGAVKTDYSGAARTTPYAIGAYNP